MQMTKNKPFLFNKNSQLPAFLGTFINWWDMIRFFASQPIDIVWEIGDVNQKAVSMKVAVGPGAEITPEVRSQILSFLDKLEGFVKSLVLEEAGRRITLWRTMLRAGGEDELPCYYPVVSSELSGIEYAITEELSKRLAILLPAGKAELCDQEELFGQEVHQAFSEARQDIKEAGSCLALGLHTAAVFHLMRVAEFGLRRISRELKISLRRNNKWLPIQYATWGEVIAGINRKLSSPKAPKRQATLEFYHIAVLEIRAFKDLWRNPVMHTRIHYDETQAQSALAHIRNFIERLAARELRTRRTK